MATQEQIKYIEEYLSIQKPFDVSCEIDRTNVGMGFILRVLYTEDEVSSGHIAEKMHVSTARVAALLKKMEARELITRESSKKDARVTVVKLTEKGKEETQKLIDVSILAISRIIDEIGFDRIKEYIILSHDINLKVFEILEDLQKNKADN